MVDLQLYCDTAVSHIRMLLYSILLQELLNCVAKAMTISNSMFTSNLQSFQYNLCKSHTIINIAQCN